MSNTNRMRILIDMATGLMTRLSISKAKLTNEDSKPAFLSDPELKKIISKLEKSYPFEDKLPDLTKYGDSDKYFYKNAISIKRKLDRFIVIVTDLADFCAAAIPILIEFPFTVTEFSLERNRNLSVLYFDLLSSYIKVMLLFSSLKERKTLVALYAATSIFLSNNIDEPKENISKVPTLIAHSEDVYLHFITSFKNLSSNSANNTNTNSKFKNMLLQFKTSIMFGDDIEKLVNSSVLNFMLEGDQMGMPAIKKMPLQGSAEDTNLSAYTELMSYDKYISYVICSVLAVPILLYDSEIFHLYQVVGSKRHFMTIFRDEVLSIHAELEKVSYEYISKKDAPHISITPGFKLKTALRNVAKEAAKTAGLRARSRRSYLHAELKSVNLLLKTIPGLLAPKLPQILALSSLTKAEVIDFFVHMDAQDNIRKDVRKHYQIQDTHDNIFPLLESLCELVKCIKGNNGLAKIYYTQFVSINDLRVVSPLCERCSKSVPSVQPHFDQIIESLKALSSPATDKGVSLESFRLNWDRAIETMCIGVNDHITRDIYFESLLDRMHSTSERTMFVDRLDYLIEEYGEPYELFWYSSKLLGNYKKCVSISEKSPLYPSIALSALWIPTLSHCNLHAEALYEANFLEESSHSLADTLLSILEECVISQFKDLWDHLFSLDLQYQPVEAGKRIVRAMKAKRNSILKGSDPLPGEESEGWAAVSIDKLMKIKSFLASLSATVNNWKSFRVYNRKYHLVKFLTQRLRNYVNEQLADVFIVHVNPDDTSSTQLQRPVYIILRFVTLVMTLKHVTSFLALNAKTPKGTVEVTNTTGTNATTNVVDFSAITRDILYSLIVPDSPTDSAKPVVADSIAECVVDLIIEISSGDSVGLIWCPFRREFCSNPYPNNASSANGTTWGRRGASNAQTSNPNDLELILNQTDLFHLCKIIGPLGVKHIEQRIFGIVGVHMKAVIAFLKENKDTLREYQSNYCLGIKFSAKSLPNIETFYQTLKIIGVALACREMLRDALAKSLDTLDPLTHSISTTTDSLLKNVPKSDYGYIPKVDVAFIEAMDAVMKKENIVDTNNLFSLFPAASALLFLTEKWNKSHYISSLDGFTNNEHCIQLAVVKLMNVFFNKDAISADTSAISSSSDGDGLSLLTKTITEYIKISGQLFLTQLDNEERPMRAMCALLSHFIMYCPLQSELGLKVVEKYFPHAITRMCHTDVLLGKQRLSDNYNPFCNINEWDEADNVLT